MARGFSQKGFLHSEAPVTALQHMSVTRGVGARGRKLICTELSVRKRHLSVYKAWWRNKLPNHTTNIKTDGSPVYFSKIDLN